MLVISPLSFLFVCVWCEHTNTQTQIQTQDIDACDPFFASATGTKVRGGLTYRESHYICEHLAWSELLHSMDMVEVNPRLADKKATDETVQIALSLIGSALGESVL